MTRHDGAFSVALVLAAAALLAATPFVRTGRGQSGAHCFTRADSAEDNRSSCDRVQVSRGGGSLVFVHGASLDASAMPADAGDAPLRSARGRSTNGAIAFIDRGNVAIIDADGSHFRHLIPPGRLPGLGYYFVTWSHEGRRLIAQASEGLWLLNADGTGLRLLSKSLRGASSPDWSPDGTSVAVECCFGDDPPSARVVSIATGRIRVVVRNGQEPHWSPQGDLIAFERRRGIWVVHPNGTGVRRLTTGSYPYGFVDFIDTAPWSPDGRAIAYSRTVKYQDRDVHVVNIQTATDDLIASDGDDYNAAWSPDGSTILFVCRRPDYGQICAAQPDGSDARQLTNIAVSSSQHGTFGATWSPDGKLIAFTRVNDGSDRQSKIWVMNADGTDARRVTNRSGDFFGTVATAALRSAAFVRKEAAQQRSRCRWSIRATSRPLDYTMIN